MDLVILLHRSVEMHQSDCVQRNNNRRGVAPVPEFEGVVATAGPETVRLPREVSQRVQVNSWSSPEGSTSNNRSRTGCAVLHFGQ